MTNTKMVTDVYGRKLTVCLDKRKLLCYNNSKKYTKYSAPIVKDDKVTFFWTDYEETGTIKDLETRINAINSPIRYWYAVNAVKYNATKKDPTGELWRKTIEVVEQNEDVFFFKNGNFKNGHRQYHKAIKPLLNKLVLGKS